MVEDINLIEKEKQLPESITKTRVGNKQVYLLGTAHVSKESVLDVERSVNLLNPDAICVELCESRYKTLKNPDDWKKMDIFKVVKEKKSMFLLAQMLLGTFYKKIGEKLDVKPGAEMLEGVKQAEKTGAELVLADRDVQVTLKRVWKYLGFWNKLKFFPELLLSFFESDEIDEDMIEEIKKQDQLESILETFAKDMPQIKEKLIDERDIYLAQKIRESKGQKVLAIVGAGHVSGIVKHIEKDHDLTELNKIPSPSQLSKFIQWLIPALIVGLIVYGFFKGGTEKSVESIYIWFLINGIFSALGAMFAFAHPLTVITAFVAAPLTSLNPMIAAGWVSGLTQVWVKKPKVDDFEKLNEDLSSFKGFWMNPVSRILLVVALSNLGSSIGTFVAGSMIAAKVL